MREKSELSLLLAGRAGWNGGEVFLGESPGVRFQGLALRVGM